MIWTELISGINLQAFLQSGSLLARSCQSAMALAGHSQEIQTQAALFGENIAYAKQVHVVCDYWLLQHYSGLYLWLSL